jgi:hypothetical protein
MMVAVIITRRRMLVVMIVVVTMVVTVVLALGNHLPKEPSRTLPKEGSHTEQDQATQRDPLNGADFVVLSEDEDSVSHSRKERIDRQSHAHTDGDNQSPKVEGSTTTMES